MVQVAETICIGECEIKRTFETFEGACDDGVW
jgi:hypothetical protein